MIDWRRAQALRAIAQYGTVTAAADVLHVAASAVSQQIAKLERELGMRLVEPCGRSVRLTAAARGLLVHLDAIEERWHLAVAELHDVAHDEPVGSVRVCGFATAVSSLVVPAVAALRRSGARVTVSIREAEPVECFDLLLAGDADLAVVEVTPECPAVDDARFEQRPLVDDPFDLLVAAGHRLADRGSVDLAEAAEEPWVVGMPGSSSRQLVVSACASAGFSPAIAHEAREWSVVATLVGEGLGVALVPRLAHVPPAPALARVALSGSPAPSRKLVTCTRRGSRADGPIAAVDQALREIVARRP